MSTHEPDERLSPDDAKAVIKTIEELEREEAAPESVDEADR